MALNVTRPSINIESQSIKQTQRVGLKGKQILESNTIQEARSNLGLGNKNLIINGNFDIWQRGSSFDVDTIFRYTADRAHIAVAASNTAVIDRAINTSPNTDATYEYKLTSDGTSASNACWATGVEIGDIVHLINKKLTFSFWKKGKPGPFLIFLRWRNGIISIANEVIIGNFTLTQDTLDWQHHTVTFTLPDHNVGNVMFMPIVTVGPDINGEVSFSGMQLEAGSEYTKIKPRSKSDELKMCQRYYQKSYDEDVDPGSITLDGAIFEYSTRNAANTSIGARFKVRMRNTPTMVVYSDNSSTPGLINNGTNKAGTPVLIGEDGWSQTDITAGSTATDVVFHYTADSEL